MASGVEKYNLTDEEFQKCLKMAEMKTFLQGVSYENPKSIFVVAQPGAGKTGLKSYSLNQAQIERAGVFIEVNPDEISLYHKYYDQIINEFPDESHAQLQKFVKPALDNYLRQKAVALRNNILQEGTFGSTQGYMEILDFQKNGGKAKIGPLKDDNTREEVNVRGNYQIEINVLAVHKFESLLSSYEREQYFVESNLTPRAVTLENHDYSYNKMLDTLKQIEENKLFDKIRVFKRGRIETEPELVYISTGENFSDIAKVVEKVREEEKEKLLKSPQNYLNRINALKSKHPSQNLLARLERLEQEFMIELEKEKNRGIER